MSKLSSWRLPAPQDVHLDVDRYLNRIILPPQLHKLPKWISRFLGYRENPVPDVGNILVAFWSLVGAFYGLILVGAVLKYSPSIKLLDPPVMFASLGASAILQYGEIKSPLAQPRNSIVGHGLSAIVGVAIAKLFRLNSNFEDIRWIVGALGCGVASAVMALTNTVHPPGGATAVLAVVDPAIGELGWMFIPLILMGVILMLVVALVVNNIQRRFPTCWWTPKEVGWQKANPTDAEGLNSSGSGIVPLEDSLSHPNPNGSTNIIVLGPDGISSPGRFVLNEEESLVLNGILARLNGYYSNSVSSSKLTTENGGPS